jgi:hypothetical protein
VDGGADVEAPRVGTWRRGTDRIWQGVSGRGRHWWFAIGVVLALTLQVGRRSLDEALLDLHPPNEKAYSANQLHEGVDAAAQALTSWDRGSVEFEDFLRIDGRAIGKYHALVEVVLVPVMFLLLYAAGRWLRSQLERNADADPSGEGFSVVRYLLHLSLVIALPLYLLLGLLNQGLEYSLLSRTPLATAAAPADPSDGVARVLEVSSWVRIVSLVLVLVPIFIALFHLSRSVWHPVQAIRDQGAAFRVVLFVVIAYAAAMLLGTPAEQGRDAIRFWRNQPWQAGFAYAAVAWFAVTVAAIGLRLRARPIEAGSRGQAMTTAVLWCLAGASVFLAGWIGEEGWGRLGGLQVLGAILFVVGLLSLPIAIWGTRRPRAGGPPPNPALAPPAPAAAYDQPPGQVVQPGASQVPQLVPALAPAPLTAIGAPAVTMPVTAIQPGTISPAPDAITAAPGAMTAEPGAMTARSTLVPGLLAFVPLLVFGLTIIQATLPEVLARSGAALPLGVAGLALLSAIFIYVSARNDNSWLAFIAWPGLGYFFRFISTSLVLLLGFMVWVWLRPWFAPPFVGVQALLGGFFTLVTILLGGIGYVVEGWRVPSALRVLGLRRIPLVTIVIVWAILAATFVSGDAYHAVRIESADAVAPDARSLAVDEAFARWLEANAPTASGAEGERTAIPLVLVSAAGGGIKAASFTATVTDCLFAGVDQGACRPTTNPDAWQSVFALSGASGGSVGFASTLVQRDEDARQTDWVRERLGTDLLSPSLAWQLFVEAGNSLVRYDPGLDRAEVLERSWERRWGSDEDDRNPARAFAFGAQDEWEGPLLFFSGTDLFTGCRANVSRLNGTVPPSQAPPGSEGRDCRRRRLVDTAPPQQQVSVDVLDYLCRDQDIRMSTAAFLSARFPFVSPVGELRPAADRGDVCTEARGARTLAIGDGGYRDNTGAGALADMWSVLEPLVAEHNAQDGASCVVPFYVEIDNGYRNRVASSADGGLRQMLAPLTGALAVFSARDAGWPETLAADFRRPLEEQTIRVSGSPLEERFARLSLFAHPGVQAPLGWLLSDAAVDDIQRQLTVPDNAAAIREINRWLEPGSLSC